MRHFLAEAEAAVGAESSTRAAKKNARAMLTLTNRVQKRAMRFTLNINILKELRLNLVHVHEQTCAIGKLASPAPQCQPLLVKEVFISVSSV